MTHTDPSSGRTWLYRFSRPGGIEIETRELNGDEAAEIMPGELSKSQVVPGYHRAARPR